MVGSAVSLFFQKDKFTLDKSLAHFFELGGFALQRWADGIFLRAGQLSAWHRFGSPLLWGEPFLFWHFVQHAEDFRRAFMISSYSTIIIALEDGYAAINVKAL